MKKEPIAKIGDKLTFPQMLDDPAWEKHGKQTYEVIGFDENGDVQLKMCTPIVE